MNQVLVDSKTKRTTPKKIIIDSINSNNNNKNNTEKSKQSSSSNESELNDTEALIKLKQILKTLNVSSYYYRTILSDGAFQTLVKLHNYEKTLNCKLQNCLHNVNDINDYILNSIDKTEIKSIVSKVNIPKASLSLSSDTFQFSDNNENDDNYFMKQKPSSFEIKSNPYSFYYELDNSENEIINNIDNYQKCNSTIVQSSNVSYINANSSYHSNSSFNSSIYESSKNDGSFQTNRQSIPTNYSNSILTDTTQTNLSSIRTDSTNQKTNDSKKHRSLLNLTSTRKITPTAINQSTSQMIFSDNLDNNANLCKRNHIRRNAISNPFHIPLKEGVRELYERNLHLSEASLQNKIIKKDDVSHITINENKFMSFLSKICECFKPNKIENYDSSTNNDLK